MIELLVVIVVIAILLAVAAPSFLGQQEKAHDSNAQQTLAIVYRTAKAETVRDRRFPAAAQLIAQIARGEPQFTGRITETDTPAAGQLGVCANSTSTTLNVVAHSDSGNAYLLQATARGGYRLGRGLCSGFHPEAKLTAGHALDPEITPLDSDEFVFRGMTAAETDWGRANLFIARRDGSGTPRQLTTDGLGDSHPAVSPDRTKIAFVRDNDIYTVNADGSGLRNLTPDTPSHEHTPAWSADGTTIAFASDRTGRYTRNIFVMNADGTNVTQVTSSAHDNGAPVFWPGSTMTLMFTSNRLSEGQIPPYYTLETVDIPSGARTGLLPADSHKVGRAAITPDGSKVVWVTVSGGKYRIMSLNLATDSQAELYSDPTLLNDVAAGSDGRLYFTEDTATAQVIRSMNIDGSDLMTITPEHMRAAQPAG